MRSSAIQCALAALTCTIACLLTTPVRAMEPPQKSLPESHVLPARDSARLPGAGHYSIGIFNPLEYGVSDKLSLVTHPLLLVASPNVTARVRHGEVAGWRLTGEYGLSVPYAAMGSELPLGLGGWLFPACKVTQHDSSKSGTCDQAGWVISPTIGAVASSGDRHVWTVRTELSVGLPISGDLGRPSENIPPADLLFAPATYGWRLRVGGRYDRALSDNMRLSTELNGYMVGASEAPSRNPLTVSAHVGLDISVGSHSRFTIGVLYFNSDQRNKVEEVIDGRPQLVPVRNHDFFPTIDFIWAG
ncbi:MAG: hypothetical protein KC502_16760 [Myxococcales bacterium]|nr:hypothetical protein [Myxococcales bacterium]